MSGKARSDACIRDALWAVKKLAHCARSDGYVTFSDAFACTRGLAPFIEETVEIVVRDAEGMAPSLRTLVQCIAAEALEGV